MEATRMQGLLYAFLRKKEFELRGDPARAAQALLYAVCTETDPASLLIALVDERNNGGKLLRLVWEHLSTAETAPKLLNLALSPRLHSKLYDSCRIKYFGMLMALPFWWEQLKDIICDWTARDIVAKFLERAILLFLEVRKNEDVREIVEILEMASPPYPAAQRLRFLIGRGSHADFDADHEKIFGAVDSTPYLPVKVIRQNQILLEDAEYEYLDRHFRWLRHDFVQPMRTRLLDFMDQQNYSSDHGPRAFDSVFVRDIIVRSKLPPCVLVEFTQPQMLARRRASIDKGAVLEFWRTVSGLKLGALVYFKDCNTGQALFFATIVVLRDEWLLRPDGSVHVGLNFGGREDFTACLAGYRSYQIRWNICVASTGFCMYETILRRLQNLEKVHLGEILLRQYSNTSSGESAEQQPFRDGWRILPSRDGDENSFTLRNGRKVRLDTSERDAVESLKQASSLDHSQSRALVHCLTNQVALVQGPPGTGKSFTGTEYVSIVLNNAPGLRILVQEKLAEINVNLWNMRAWRRVEKLLTSEGRLDVLEQLTADRDDDDRWIRVGTPDIVWKRWYRGKPANDIVAQVGPLWSLDRQERQALVENEWTQLYRAPIIAELADLFYQYCSCREQLDAIYQRSKTAILRDCRVIGATTSGAAVMFEMIEAAEPDIVLFEEAGEILEAHVIATLPRSIKQLVLIGDHQQLRPKVAEYRMTSVSRGPFSLDVSLFERLIVQGMHSYVTLAVQRRMRPEISCLIKPFYPALTDHADVSGRPDISVVLKNVIFWDHRIPENDMAALMSETPLASAKVSKRNLHEARLAIELARLLIFGGGYVRDMSGKTDDLGITSVPAITILTPYLGQLVVLRDLVRECFGELQALMNERDLEDLRSSGLLPKDEYCIETRDVSGVPAEASSRQQKRCLLFVSTVDNYQGNEADIIIVSLVRSNIDGSIGFLKEAERVTVLLSRARMAMYLIGNSETFRSHSLWDGTIFPILDASHAVLDYIPSVCTKHGVYEALRTPEDFRLRRCSWECEHRGACEHECGVPCDRLPCDLRCNELLKCGHQCISVCGERCPLICQICESDETIRSQVVDLLTFGTFQQQNLDSDAVLALGCGHLLCMSTKDGLFEMDTFYARVGNGGDGPWVRALMPDSGVNRPVPCPQCRELISRKSLKRYGRSMNARNWEALKFKYGNFVRGRCREAQQESNVAVGCKGLVKLWEETKNSRKNPFVRAAAVMGKFIGAPDATRYNAGCLVEIGMTLALRAASLNNTQGTMFTSALNLVYECIVLADTLTWIRHGVDLRVRWARLVECRQDEVRRERARRELDWVIQHSDNVTVSLDDRNEAKRLAEFLRVHTPEQQ
ncbi:NFX1-type zinc finger-containing protein 1 [Porphyridium purpureum]|uniref:NFX1-type zinc finger-containing protein 1 n=1 Tax=Porphyridium purpureum TaxID=35688 RepID=A0A5J4Z3X0_PORPP|nr:NFX1-type zinc finger-containing protein 1 [Porphyridium purpureum]|eukprot:POR4265..scf295_1